MPDAKPEEVKMSHLHALDRRISDHKLEVSESLNDTIKQIVKPMNDLTTEIKLSNQNYGHLKDDLSRIAGIAEGNSKKIVGIDKELAVVRTTQGGILGVSGKVFPMFFAGLGLVITLLLGISIYFKAIVGI